MNMTAAGNALSNQHINQGLSTRSKHQHDATERPLRRTRAAWQSPVTPLSPHLAGRNSANITDIAALTLPKIMTSYDFLANEIWTNELMQHCIAEMKCGNVESNCDKHKAVTKLFFFLLYMNTSITFWLVSPSFGKLLKTNDHHNSIIMGLKPKSFVQTKVKNL